MSRIGKMPVQLPSGVTVKIDGPVISVKGPKGELTRTINSDMKVEIEDNMIIVTPPGQAKPHRAMHGLTRTLINNMVVGVTTGFTKTLELVGTGYRAQLDGTKLVLAIGYSHPVEFTAEDDISFEVPAPNRIVVNGIKKEHVGQVAADIRKVRPPEPYLGKGIKYENEYIARKEGKAGK